MTIKTFISLSLKIYHSQIYFSGEIQYLKMDESVSRFQRLSVKLRDDRLKSLEANKQKVQYTRIKRRLEAQERSQRKKAENEAQGRSQKKKAENVAQRIKKAFTHY